MVKFRHFLKGYLRLPCACQWVRSLEWHSKCCLCFPTRKRLDTKAAKMLRMRFVIAGLPQSAISFADVRPPTRGDLGFDCAMDACVSSAMPT
jgi:hypothetical protein